MMRSFGPWGMPAWWAELAGELFDDVFILAPTAYPTALAAVAPLASGDGPLGAVHAALVLARSEQVVVLPEALPAPELLRALVQEPAEMDLVLAPGDEELPARLHRRCLKPVERALARGEKSLPAGLRAKRL